MDMPESSKRDPVNDPFVTDILITASTLKMGTYRHLSHYLYTQNKNLIGKVLKFIKTDLAYLLKVS